MKNYVKLFENYSRSEMNGGLKQISLDLTSEDFLNICQEIVEQFNLQIIKLIPLGPGGGNPEVTFRGREQDILGLVEWYCELSGDDDPEGFYEDYVTDDMPITFEVYSDPRMSTRERRRHIGPKGRPLF